MGDKYNLFMVEEPNSEGPDPRGGPRVSFGMLRKEVSEPGPTTLWQYVIPLLLFVPTIGSSVELGIASQFKSILLDQKTKVYIPLAVPFAGATLSFSMFAVGLLLSSNPNAAGDLVQVPSMVFQEQRIQPQFGSILL